ncbi:MAG: LysR family transcriptional regulator [Proteobacteria bacterium]|nr:LysR family transcriptional regulator [Pseudomonadota bacterium]
MPALVPLPSMRQLRHLVAVADHGHFGRAAEACLITQSSMSASIKELETLLGKVLIERTRRSVMLTPLGTDIVARARKVLTDAEAIVDLVTASGAPLAGSIRLGVIPTIGPFLLPRVLPALRSAYPELKLYLREEQTGRLIDGLAAGDLDLLLIAFPYPTPGFETHLFAEDPFWVAFPRGHGFAAKERLTGADLEGEEVLLLEEGHCLRDHALSACDTARHPGAAEFQASSLHTLVQMVDNGLGLTLLPKMAIDAGIARGTRVEARPLEGKGTSRKIGFAWRPSSPRKHEFALLAEFFRDELATPLPPHSNPSASK